MAAEEWKGILLVLKLTMISRKKIGLVNVQKSFRKNILKLLTAIKLKIFQRRSITTLRYKPMGDKGCLSCVDK